MLEKEKLLTPRATTSHGMPEDTIDLPELGGTVKVRGLNRLEVMGMRAITSPVERERHMVSAAMLEPRMTLDEVAEWQKVSAGGGELETVTTKIAELSKMLPGSAKETVKAFRR